MNKDELLNRVIEMVESYIEDQPNMQYYPNLYASRMEVLNELKNSMLVPNEDNTELKSDDPEYNLYKDNNMELSRTDQELKNCLVIIK